MSDRSILLSIAPELRQRILQFALAKPDGIQLYFPVRHKRSCLNPSLFRVCRTLREEALEAFYQSNCFIWIIGPQAAGKSNPTLYPISDHTIAGGITTPALPPLTPCLPWQYPRIFRDLRFLCLEVYVTCMSTKQEEYWDVELVPRLEKFVELVDKGHRLHSLELTVHAYYAREQPALTPELIEAVNRLTGLEIRGKLEVQIATNDPMSTQIFDNMNLETQLRPNGT